MTDPLAEGGLPLMGDDCPTIKSIRFRKNRLKIFKKEIFVALRCKKMRSLIVWIICFITVIGHWPIVASLDLTELVDDSSLNGGGGGGVFAAMYSEKIGSLEKSIAAVFNKVAYGSTTTKRSIPDAMFVPTMTTVPTPPLTTFR